MPVHSGKGIGRRGMPAVHGKAGRLEDGDRCFEVEMRKTPAPEAGAGERLSQP